MSFFLFNYFDFIRMSESYAAFQNETKRRRTKNKNSFNIFNDDNINFFNSNSNSFYDFNIVHNRTLQKVTFIVNNRFSSKRNRNHRVVDFKNKRILSSLNMWFYFVYVDVNIVEITFSKLKKNNKLFDFKNQTLKRFTRQSRVERHIFFCHVVFASIETYWKKNKLQKKSFSWISNSNSIKKRKIFFWTCDANNKRQ